MTCFMDNSERKKKREISKVEVERVGWKKCAQVWWCVWVFLNNLCLTFVSVWLVLLDLNDFATFQTSRRFRTFEAMVFRNRVRSGQRVLRRERSRCVPIRKWRSPGSVRSSSCWWWRSWWSRCRCCRSTSCFISKRWRLRSQEFWSNGARPIFQEGLTTSVTWPNLTSPNVTTPHHTTPNPNLTSLHLI